MDYLPIEIKIDNQPYKQLAVNMATSRKSKRRGFLGKEKIPAPEGLLLPNSFFVHMIGMQFALDLIFMDKKGIIIKIYSNVQPGPKIKGGIKCKYCLELAAGQADALHLNEGQSITWSRVNSS